VEKLVEILAGELERPRELSSRVLNYIIGKYELDYDAVGPFLVNELPKLEVDDLDLILSPIFTPKLADQAMVAAVLVDEHVPREEFSRLVEEIASRPTRAQLLTPDGETHLVELREVTIERYIHRLRLEGGIPESLLELLDAVSSNDLGERPLLYAIARRTVWESAGAREILTRYLTRARELGAYSLPDLLDLLELVEGRKPANVADLLERLPGWQKALQEQIDAGSQPKAFFLQEIEMMHGGSRDQRRQGDTRLSTKEKDLEFLTRLQGLL